MINTIKNGDHKTQKEIHNKFTEIHNKTHA